MVGRGVTRHRQRGLWSSTSTRMSWPPEHDEPDVGPAWRIALVTSSLVRRTTASATCSHLHARSRSRTKRRALPGDAGSATSVVLASIANSRGRAAEAVQTDIMACAGRRRTRPGRPRAGRPHPPGILPGGAAYL